MFNSEATRKMFPAISQKINGHDFIYLDSAATALKHQSVIDEIMQYYKFESANIHRGVYSISETASTKYENSRLTVQKFIKAKFSHEIIFSKGTTESINLIAQSWGREHIKE